MAIKDKLKKAVIKNLDTGTEVSCMFNPKEYTFKKTNSWTGDVKIGKNVPDIKFSGGQAMTLTMDLLFDTYAPVSPEIKAGEDVRTYTDEIWKLMRINEKNKDKGHKGWPPLCQFTWGETWSFTAAITQLSQKFTLFLSDGRPVRSTLTVTFQQMKDEGQYPGQNPTTVSKPGFKTRRVREGETLDWIAFDEYGDPNHWRFLADVNHLDNPSALQPGQVLAIAPLP
ncbi:MAG: LysM peptidoglycan-binding domain-containing protein [Dehalococcoidia bacterium]